MDPFWGGMDLPRRHFLVKMFVKTKELGPIGGGRAPDNFVSRSANANIGFLCVSIYLDIQIQQGD